MLILSVLLLLSGLSFTLPPFFLHALTGSPSVKCLEQTVSEYIIIHFWIYVASVPPYVPFQPIQRVFSVLSSNTLMPIFLFFCFLILCCCKKNEIFKKKLSKKFSLYRNNML